jgi:hypothetical protein
MELTTTTPPKKNSKFSLESTGADRRKYSADWIFNPRVYGPEKDGK